MKTNLYSKLNTESLTLRDILAIDRTILSNERTFLAYIRTALTLLLGGVGLKNLLENDWIMNFLGSVFIIISVLIFIAGLDKYFKKKKHISKLKKVMIWLLYNFKKDWITFFSVLISFSGHYIIHQIFYWGRSQGNRSITTTIIYM